MTTQQIASILRQIAAVGAVVMGCLTATLNGIHLPPAVSAVLTAAGGGLLWIEHYVGDPSTGTATVPTPTPSVVAQLPPTPTQPTSGLPTFD